MKHAYYKTFLLLLLIIAINGCKPDEPLYPAKTVPIPGYHATTDPTGTGGSDTTGIGGTDTTGTGTGGKTGGTGATGGGVTDTVTTGTGSNGLYVDDGKDIPLGPAGTIIFKVNGNAQQTISSGVSFVTITAAQSMGLYPNGATVIAGGDNNTGISLSFAQTQIGNFSASSVTINPTSKLNMVNLSEIINVTSYTSNSIQGTFRGEVIDLDGNTGRYFVKGAFNLKR